MHPIVKMSGLKNYAENKNYDVNLKKPLKFQDDINWIYYFSLHGIIIYNIYYILHNCNKL